MLHQYVFFKEDATSWLSGEGRRTYFDKFESRQLSSAGSSSAGSVSRDLNSQKLHY